MAIVRNLSGSCKTITRDRVIITTKPQHQHREGFRIKQEIPNANYMNLQNHRKQPKQSLGGDPEVDYSININDTTATADRLWRTTTADTITVHPGVLQSSTSIAIYARRSAIYPLATRHIQCIVHAQVRKTQQTLLDTRALIPIVCFRQAPDTRSCQIKTDIVCNSCEFCR